MRVFAIAAAVLALAPVLVAGASVNAPARANLPELARNLVRAGAPGALVYVRTPKTSRAGVAGFADLATRVSMRPSFRYRIASVSKAFVSTVILQLEAEGKLRIDDPVERWLPGLVPNGATITLRELMNHTSGLFDYTDDTNAVQQLFANPSRPWTPRELLAIAAAHAPVFAPGSNWSYSNTNYIALGLVVEAVTRHSLGEELQRRIFTPLSLKSTSFPQTIQLAHDFVHGYFTAAKVDIAPVLSPTWAWAAGGIVSSARDVTTFYRALLSGRLLPARQRQELTAGSATNANYGLGIETTFTSCGRVYYHDGDFVAWRNVTMATASGKREAVVMVNDDDSQLPFARLVATVQAAVCRG